MSSFAQVLTVLVFLAYSVAYFMFIAWAAERAKGPSPRSAGPLVAHLLGVVVPLGALLVFLRT